VLNLFVAALAGPVKKFVGNPSVEVSPFEAQISGCLTHGILVALVVILSIETFCALSWTFKGID